MTRVVFVNPHDSSVSSQGLGIKTPPLHLMYLAGMVEEAGLNPVIIDANLLDIKPDKIGDNISRLSPHLVGLTATTATISKVFQYIKEIRISLPDSFIFIGGPHATALPVETLNACDELDAVVIGEGEETVKKLVKSFSTNDPNWPDDVRGIVYKRKDGSSNRIITTPPRDLIQDLDTIPFPARHRVLFDRYKILNRNSSIGFMITSRGCTFACNYCSSSHLMGTKYRVRSPKNVVDEMEELAIKYQVDTIEFLDDNFMLDHSRALSIAREIRSRDLDISFIASSRVNGVNHYVLSELKKAGLSTIYYGVESGSERTLQLMNKRITLSSAERAVRIAKECNLRVLTSFILGYPGETLEDMDATIRFAARLDPDYAQFTILTPYPGTPIYQELKDKDLLATEDWDRYTVLDPVIRYEAFGITPKQASRKLQEAYLRFYLRPSYLLKRKYLLKTILFNLYHSYLRPVFRHADPKGWYQKFPK